MSNQPTLASIFEATKGELAASLSGLTVPKDTEKIQEVIAGYLNKVCDEQSEYRQNLTQSEDYILQAALSMLNAQRALVSTFDCQPDFTVVTEEESGERGADFATSSRVSSLSNMSLTPTSALIGAGGGALVGKLAFGGWGAVFCALAGTAVALYVSKSSAPVQTPKVIKQTTREKVVIKEVPVDTTTLLTDIAHVCESLDELIATFRTQIQKVVHKYESIQAPTLEGEYSDILQNIQALLGAYAMDQSNANRTARIEQRIELLQEGLEGYNLKVVNYDGDNQNLFTLQPSANVSVPTMVLPAITKDGKVVMKGKVFITQ